jgi:release factor glutamine methyltransferase
VGIDTSSEALAQAAENADRHGVRDRVHLTNGDLLTPVESQGSVDAVVSNPPYLDDALMASLAPDIAQFEPHVALYGGPDGLDLIRRLIDDAVRVLKPGGVLALEVAGATQMNALQTIIDQHDGYSECQSVKDYQKIPRVLVAQRADDS